MQTEIEKPDDTFEATSRKVDTDTIKSGLDTDLPWENDIIARLMNYSLRATFPNPKATLRPGSYVRIRIAQGTLPGAVIVPAQAIQRSSAGVAQVFVVAENGTAALRPVRTGALTDGGWIVEDGLKAGETVVVEGFQRLQPGMPVNPSPWQASRTASASVKP